MDEAGYAQILQQVRDKEFQRELERRAQEIEQQKKNDLIIAQMEQDKSHRRNYPERTGSWRKRIESLKQLQSQIANSKTQNQLAIHQAILAKEQENSAAIIKKQAELTDKDREIEHPQGAAGKSGHGERACHL